MNSNAPHGEEPEAVKLYPVWSNFIYFVAAVYAFFVAITYKRFSLNFNLFFIYFVLILCTGIFSIVYHLHTPSWTGKFNTHKTPKFKKWLNVDVGFAVSLLIYSILFLIVKVLIFYQKQQRIPFHQLKNPNFFLSILFIILSVVFFQIAGNHYSEAHSCNNRKNNNHFVDCFSKNLDAYDILHSNWHIFTSLALIFWISWLSHASWTAKRWSS